LVIPIGAGAAAGLETVVRTGTDHPLRRVVRRFEFFSYLLAVASGMPRFFSPYNPGTGTSGSRKKWCPCIYLIIVR